MSNQSVIKLNCISQQIKTDEITIPYFEAVRRDRYEALNLKNGRTESPVNQKNYRVKTEPMNTDTDEAD